MHYTDLQVSDAIHGGLKSSVRDDRGPNYNLPISVGWSSSVTKCFIVLPIKNCLSVDSH